MKSTDQVKDDSGQKHVGIWIRVSTEDQAKGESPEHHERRARAYAEAKGWTVRETYHLEGVSGKSVREHSEAKRMLADIVSGRITGLIFSKLARLARNTRELLDFADLFREHGADLVSLHESIDTTTPAGRLFYTMIAAMAQWEREEIGERVAASIPIRAKLGKSTGGAAPFGYQWKDKQLVPDPQEAPVRKLMYELFAEHRRKKAVARLLNEKGYRTRSGAKFSDTTVGRLILDPTAKGTRRANYTRSLGQKKHWKLKPKEDWVLLAVEPIVSEELWAACVAILEARRDSGKRPSRKPVHLFTGHVFCHCGHKMYVPSNMPKYVCYRCHNKIAVGDLDSVFHEQLRDFFLSPEDVARHLGQADEEIKAKEERLVALESEATKLRQEMDKTYRLYLADQISPDGFGRTYRPLEERLKSMEAELPRLQGEVDCLKVQLLAKDEILAETRDLYSRWPALVADEKRAIVEAIVERIQVSRDTVEIDLVPYLGSAEVAAERQHNLSAALPFCNLRLAGPRPRVLPKGYPVAPNTLGEHIRRRRLDLGLTQRTLGRRLGVRGATVAEWESGRYRPLDRHWPGLLGLLGDDLLPAGGSPAGRLESARCRLGLSRRAFAVRVGLDEGSICRWVRGQRKPSPWMARRIEAILADLEADQRAVRAQPNYFDLSCWRRTPPAGARPRTFGERLRARRLELGQSRAELGRRLGVTPSTVHRWERGDFVPGAGHSERLKKWLEEEDRKPAERR